MYIYIYIYIYTHTRIYSYLNSKISFVEINASTYKKNYRHTY